MKIYKALSLISLLAVLVTSCTKSTVQPAVKPIANTKTSQNTIYAYSPTISGAIGGTLPDPALAGNWTLVSDSTFISHGESAAFNSGTIYTGQPGDYFNINSDGKISANEGSNYQTIACVETNSANNSFELWYTQYPNVTIAGSGFIRAEFLQPVVTAHSATLTSQIVGTMGVYTRQFKLKR
jgi:hypothetical protein